MHRQSEESASDNQRTNILVRSVDFDEVKGQIKYQ